MNNEISMMGHDIRCIKMGTWATLVKEDAELAYNNFLHHKAVCVKWKREALEQWRNEYKFTLLDKIRGLHKYKNRSKLLRIKFETATIEPWMLLNVGAISDEQHQEMERTLIGRSYMAETIALHEFLYTELAECKAPCSLIAFVKYWKTRTDRLEE